jgi:MoaA/NifB/PqqE/SkfB family radical SAM enzyme
MGQAIVQLHLLRRCNLRCAHCYSESGPNEGGELPLAPLLAFLGRARAAGYSRLSLSGGEPLLYGGLVPLLRQARADGWQTSAVSNGTLLHRPDLQPALELIDLLGVSIDGNRERHNAMRRSATAFARTLTGLERLRQLGRPFALVHTLTRRTLHEVDWLIDFARTQGARALRLHPLEAVGFGTSLREDRLTPRECTEVYLRLLDRRAAGSEDGLPVEVDLLNRERLAVEPERIWPGLAEGPPSCAALADPLVVEPDGVLVPFTYGIHRRFALGHLLDPRALDEAAAAWAARLAPLVRTAMASARALPWPYFNWYEHLLETSLALGAGARPEPVPSGI